MKARITYADGTTEIVAVEDAQEFKASVESDPNIAEVVFPVDDEIAIAEAAKWN